MTLLPQAVRGRQTGRDRAHVVDPGGLGGGDGIVVEEGLLAQHPEGRDHEVDVTEAVEDVVDRFLVGRRVEGVERDRLDRGGAGGGPTGEGGRDRGRVPDGGDDRPTAAGDEPIDDRLGDLGASTQHQHRLNRTDCVSHVPSDCRSSERAYWPMNQRHGTAELG